MENDKRKQSFYFPVEMLDEVAAVAKRLDRSLSWVVQQAWRQARKEILRFPAATNPDALDAEPSPASAPASTNAAVK